VGLSVQTDSKLNSPGSDASEAVTIAVAKGRVWKDSLPILAEAGIEPLQNPDSSRRLILDTTVDHVSILTVRSADVPTYVEFGAADLGIVGKDVLMEAQWQEIYELVDMDIASCRMVVAAAESTAQRPGYAGRIQIATKYPETARRHFYSRSVQADIIHLYGSMELAPLAGLAEYIVDLVDSGATLAANRLVEIETICPVTTRLIANKTASKLKRRRIDPIVKKIRQICATAGDSAAQAAQL